MEQVEAGKMAWFTLVLGVLFFPFFPGADVLAAPLTVSQVSRDPLVLDSEDNSSIRITYHLSAPAETVIKIYDACGLLVRAIASDGLEESGEHQKIWNGRDEKGNPVLQGYYVFVIEARSQNGETVLYDLTDLTGGKPLKVSGAQYNREEKKIDYTLPVPALVNIRVGLPGGGPLLGTIVDWEARPGGADQEDWDGWDRNRVVQVSTMKGYQIGIMAYELPRNSIIVMGKNSSARPVCSRNVEAGTPRREKNDHRPKQMYNHWQHPRDACYDPAISLSLPPDLKKNEDNLPVIDGPVTVSMHIASNDQAFMYDQRFEVVYYVDFVFVYEEELGYAPFNWQWNPRGINEGIHYITVMLRGYEGHFGTATLKVFVKNPSGPEHLTEMK